MRNKLWIILIIVLIGIFAAVWSAQNNIIQNPLGRGITFPSGGENLTAGQNYTLRWSGVGDAEEVQIFLVDTSLKSQGASVSITDRVYGVPNTGSYIYTIPSDTNPGEYEFQIGNQTSATFNVLSQE